MKIPLAILGLGPAEIILVLVVLLIIFGAGRLPQIGSSLGKGLQNFRKGLKGEEEKDSQEKNDASLKEDSKKNPKS